MAEQRTQRHLRHDHRCSPPIIDITHIPPPKAASLRFSTHSAPLHSSNVAPTSRTASRHHCAFIHPTPHRSRHEMLRLSVPASTSTSYDSSIMLAILEPSTQTSCSPCWAPRLKHRARFGAAARAHPEVCPTTPNTSRKVTPIDAHVTDARERHRGTPPPQASPPLRKVGPSLIP